MDTPEAAQEITEAAPKVDEVDHSTAVPKEEVPTQESTSKEEGQDGGDQPEVSAKEPEGSKEEKPIELVLKAPEGSLLDPSRVEALSVYAKEKGLSQESAQAILDHESAAVESLANRNQKEWLESLRNDKDYGGQALEENGVLAFKAAEQWFGAEFVEIMKASHLNNHPLLFKGLVRLGRASANDKFVHASSKEVTGALSDAELFYGPQTHKE